MPYEKEKARWPQGMNKEEPYDHRGLSGGDSFYERCLGWMGRDSRKTVGGLRGPFARNAGPV
jgi:hypothetical protein